MNLIMPNVSQSSDFYPEIPFLKKTFSPKLTKPMALFGVFPLAYGKMLLIAQLFGVCANHGYLSLPLVSPGLRNLFTAL